MIWIYMLIEGVTGKGGVADRQKDQVFNNLISLTPVIMINRYHIISCYYDTLGVWWSG